MAAECARNALLQKVLDNKDNEGIDCCIIMNCRIHVELVCVNWLLTVFLQHIFSGIDVCNY
jgi:hypothetical protein